MVSSAAFLRTTRVLRLLAHRHSTHWYGPSPMSTGLSWIGAERVAIGSMPTGLSLPTLRGQGVTHIVNCRARAQTWLSQDLFAERLVFGMRQVAHAPMWDFGRPQPPALWANAVMFAVAALEDPRTGVLIHCHQGRRRSVMVAYAVLRSRGHSSDDAAGMILEHRREAEIVPRYQTSVERWLSSSAA
jgi:protein-tyrosine phosphatase